jgi:hypothetical protein
VKPIDQTAQDLMEERTFAKGGGFLGTDKYDQLTNRPSLNRPIDAAGRRLNNTQPIGERRQ